MQSILCSPGQCWVGTKATVLSLVSDTLVLSLSSLRPHNTSAIRLEKWIRIFQLSFFSHQPIKTNFPFRLIFTIPPPTLTLQSLFNSSITFSVLCHVIFLLYVKKFLSAYRAFQLYYFPVKRQLPEKTQKESKAVPLSQLLAQNFSPNSSPGEFRGVLEVDHAMWRHRWEGSTSGKVSRERARKRNFSYCYSSIYCVEDAPATSLPAISLRQQKKEHLSIREVTQQ